MSGTNLSTSPLSHFIFAYLEAGVRPARPITAHHAQHLTNGRALRQGDPPMVTLHASSTHSIRGYTLLADKHGKHFLASATFQFFS